MKIHVFIDNIDYFLEGDYRYAFSASSAEDYGKNYSQPDSPYVGSAEFDMSHIDLEGMSENALEVIREEEIRVRAEFQKRMDLLEEKRQKLLAITHKDQS